MKSHIANEIGKAIFKIIIRNKYVVIECTSILRIMYNVKLYKKYRKKLSPLVLHMIVY